MSNNAKESQVSDGDNSLAQGVTRRQFFKFSATTMATVAVAGNLFGKNRGSFFSIGCGS